MTVEKTYQQAVRLARQYGANRVVLFGSRARGDHRPQSDVDLAIWGMPQEQQAAFWAAMEELDTLLQFDLVHIGKDTSPALLENIKKDGVILMDASRAKQEQLAQAVERLQEAISEYYSTHSQVVRDGVIQRFEFCTELAWKACREYLEDQGFADLPASPKATMKMAYAAELVLDQDKWLQLLSDRNSTSHLYNEAEADRIFSRIESQHLPLLTALVQKLKEA